LIGGSADLTPSNGTAVKTWKNFEPGDYDKRYMHFGIREHGMGSIMNGMALHGGLMPFGGTFLIFSDYMRPPIRLASLMGVQVILIYTHDSIGLGEDGPTHQPVEQLSALRAIPGITVIRPADASETAEAWKVAIKHKHGPVCLVLTRQKLGYIDRTMYASAAGLAMGGYVVTDADEKPDVVLLSSGSEVGLIMTAREKLEDAGINARVVSLASHELFALQSEEYQASVLPPGVPRVAVEAAHPMSWYRWVGSNGKILGIERYGASAPYETIYKELGLTVDKIVAMAKGLVKK
jgi:transketolase